MTRALPVFVTFVVVVVVLCTSVAHGTLIGAGDITFTGFNGDGSDDFAFVTLVDIAVGESVLFVDEEWKGTAFGNAESDLLWTSDADVTAGTVVTLNAVKSEANWSASTGVLSGDAMSIGVNGEGIYAILGTRSSPSAFLAYVSTEDSPNFSGTGLDASDVVLLPSRIDVAEYTGPRSGESAWADYQPLISNTAVNWDIVTGGSGDQSGQILPFDDTRFVVVPEPHGIALGTLGGLLLLAWAGRKRRLAAR